MFLSVPSDYLTVVVVNKILHYIPTISCMKCNIQRTDGYVTG